MLSSNVSMKSYNIDYVEDIIKLKDNYHNKKDIIKNNNRSKDNHIQVYIIFKKILETNNSLNKKKNRITSGLLHFSFEHCAEIMKRADLLGYYETCMASKGKRKFDVFRRNDIQLNKSLNDNNTIFYLKSAQIRWAQLANKIGLLHYLFDNWLCVKKLYIEYKKRKFLITKRKRGRKKRQPIEGCISFNTVMNLK